jgi:hypothetical protein
MEAKMMRPSIDIDRDGDVDIDDLFAVILQWGECDPFTICSADTNHDCVVNIDDLFAVLSGWNDIACQGQSDPIPLDIQDCYDWYSNDVDLPICGGQGEYISFGSPRTVRG